ncbi:MAG: DUF3108 domain-containing protein [Saprospiraceae bacterium]|nr:DUF3108 domain-containing protein [Saprospiraceae bacterium]
MTKGNQIKYSLIVAAFLLLGSGQHHINVDLSDPISRINPCDVANEVFEDGERITYKVYYNWNFVWIAAGEVIFEVKDKGDQYHLSAIGRTFKSYDWFFKVRDYYDSYVHKESMRPSITERNVREGKYTMYDRTRYDHNNAEAVSFKGKTKETADEQLVPLEVCTHDVLSSLYIMRNVEFQSLPEGSNLPMQVYLDRQIFPLDIVYRGVVEKRVKGHGKCSTLFFEPEVVIGNIFKDKDGMKVWVSNDNNRIPLLIESPVSVGSIKAVIKDYKGLKYPISLGK